MFGPAFYHVITSVIPNFFSTFQLPLYWGRGDLTQTYFYFPPMIFILALWACIYSSAARYILACAFIILAISTKLVAPIFDHISLPQLMEGRIYLYTLRGFCELGIGVAAGIGVVALVDDIQDPQSRPVRHPGRHQIITPDMILMLRPQPYG
jgi:hypothetical protein